MTNAHKKRVKAVKILLSTIKGENPDREGLKETGERIARMYDEIFSGYENEEARLKQIFSKMFETDNDEMVIIKDIDYCSSCEHHGVFFFGKIHIGYIPNGKVLGLSKFGRLVEIYSKRLQIQEQMTFQIADAIEKYLKPKGVGVIVEGLHGCMAFRGVKKMNSKTITSAIRGVFRDNLITKQEFFKLAYA